MLIAGKRGRISSSVDSPFISSLETPTASQANDVAAQVKHPGLLDYPTAHLVRGINKVAAWSVKRL